MNQSTHAPPRSPHKAPCLSSARRRNRLSKCIGQRNPPQASGEHVFGLRSAKPLLPQGPRRAPRIDAEENMFMSAAMQWECAFGSCKDSEKNNNVEYAARRLRANARNLREWRTSSLCVAGDTGVTPYASHRPCQPFRSTPRALSPSPPAPSRNTSSHPWPPSSSS